MNNSPICHIAVFLYGVLLLQSSLTVLANPIQNDLVSTDCDHGTSTFNGKFTMEECLLYIQNSNKYIPSYTVLVTLKSWISNTKGSSFKTAFSFGKIRYHYPLPCIEEWVYEERQCQIVTIFIPGLIYIADIENSSNPWNCNSMLLCLLKVSFTWQCGNALG